MRNQLSGVRPAAAGMGGNTAWISLAQVLRLVVQAAYFTMMTRALGVVNYGAFVSVVALVSIFYPFAAGGRGNLLVQNVARDATQFPRMWGAALATIFVGGGFFILFLLLITRFALPRAIPTGLVLMVAVSDILGLNVVTVSGQAFQAFERVKWTAAMSAMINVARILGACCLLLECSRPTALLWGYVYLGSTCAVATIAVTQVTTRLGRPRFNLPRGWQEIRTGFYFSIGLSAQTIYNDIDKTMLARLDTLFAAGVYGAASRILDVSFAPVWAMLVSAYPRFFQVGVGGLGPTLRYARPLLIRGALYSLAIAITMLLAAPAVPLILGPQYQETADTLRWLAVLPLFRTISFFVSDAMSGAGYQSIRSGLQVGIALFNAAINLWLIPLFSWRGAAMASIASNIILAASVATTAMIIARREKRNGAFQSHTLQAAPEAATSDSARIGPIAVGQNNRPDRLFREAHLPLFLVLTQGRDEEQ